ncbi:MAG: hypothetical protein ACRBB3_09165 [Alphaproteobacteria bacterium]
MTANFGMNEIAAMRRATVALNAPQLRKPSVRHKNRTLAHFIR